MSEHHARCQLRQLIAETADVKTPGSTDNRPSDIMKASKRAAGSFTLAALIICQAVAGAFGQTNANCGEVLSTYNIELTTMSGVSSSEGHQAACRDWSSYTYE